MTASDPLLAFATLLGSLHSPVLRDLSQLGAAEIKGERRPDALVPSVTAISKMYAFLPSHFLIVFRPPSSFATLLTPHTTFLLSTASTTFRPTAALLLMLGSSASRSPALRTPVLSGSLPCSTAQSRRPALVSSMPKILAPTARPPLRTGSPRASSPSSTSSTMPKLGKLRGVVSFDHFFFFFFTFPSFSSSAHFSHCRFVCLFLSLSLLRFLNSVLQSVILR